MLKHSEGIMKIVFLMTACVSILAVILICVFLFASGVPAIKEIGFADFLFGMSWKPSQGIYGIFPMIIGSIYVTAGAIVIGVPIGLFCAVFMARYCPDRCYKVLKPAVDLLAGIPSITEMMERGMKPEDIIMDVLAKEFLSLGFCLQPLLSGGENKFHFRISQHDLHACELAVHIAPPLFKDTTASPLWQPKIRSCLSCKCADIYISVKGATNRVGSASFPVSSLS